LRRDLLAEEGGAGGVSIAVDFEKGEGVPRFQAYPAIGEEGLEDRLTSGKMGADEGVSERGKRPEIGSDLVEDIEELEAAKD